MRPGFIRVPISTVANEDWAHLSALAERHEICAEDIKIKNSQHSFTGGHRVRLLIAKKSVYWKIPQGISVDISQVPPQSQPPEPPRRLTR